MHLLLRIFPIFSLAIATSLPFSLVQAQTSNQTCQALLSNERSYINWYPVKPLSETVATDGHVNSMNSKGSQYHPVP
ncbi:hypothetical protein [Nostoc sp.]|uniref:hypothetical protein n=1 Tax=Nostoc sp. TaxID=1180 RepID=UPI002FF3FBE0